MYVRVAALVFQLFGWCASEWRSQCLVGWPVCVRAAGLQFGDGVEVAVVVRRAVGAAAVRGARIRLLLLSARALE